MTERKPSAVFSDCEEHGSECQSPSCTGRRYRYILRWPTGLNNDRVALGIFANPSTADAERLDPTLKRWLNYCYDWGYGWSWTCNVRAWRATDPKDVPPDPLAIGGGNGYDNWISVMAELSKADIAVLGYGKLGGEAATFLLSKIREWMPQRVLYALKINTDGSPAHPLYLPRNLKPIEYNANRSHRHGGKLA